MIGKYLIGVSLTAALAAGGYAFLERSWRIAAELALVEADKQAVEAVLEKERMSQRLAAETRIFNQERARLAREVVRRIETGGFAGADDPIDADLLSQFNRVRQAER